MSLGRAGGSKVCMSTVVFADWFSNTKGSKAPDGAGVLGRTLLAVLFQYQSQAYVTD